MSSLSFREKRILELLFGMGSGYVLNFSNRTFQEFFVDVADVDIYSEEFDRGSGSKANRLRAFWDGADDSVLADVLEELVSLAEEEDGVEGKVLRKAWHIVDRLRKGSNTPAVVPSRQTPPEVHHEFDVALSFAGEHRDYVREVADLLRAADVAVFFDEFEDLWGKDLVVELGDIYGSKSRFIVIFVSREYVAKAWTQHERQHALAGRVQRQDNSVLPAKLDGTDLPGLPSSVSYLDVSKMSARELARRIRQKLTGRVP